MFFYHVPFVLAITEVCEHNQRLGTVFPIIEEDLKQVLMKRMAKIDQRLIMEKIQQQVTYRIRNPSPIFVGAICKKYRTWLYDPTVTLEENIMNDKGDILVPKGSTFNPLQHRTLSTQLVFIDGTMPQHIKFALQQKNALIILINGSPLAIEEKHKVPIYFDQGGYLCRQFGLRAFPAKVYQEGIMLRCEEIADFT